VVNAPQTEGFLVRLQQATSFIQKSYMVGASRREEVGIQTYLWLGLFTRVP